MSVYFTIVIPTLNEELRLPLLLQDLTKQSFKNFDVIVVDARSKDGTVAKAQSFKKRIIIQALTSSKKNVSYQRNLGAASATGTYVVFLDADCRVMPDFLRSIRRTTLKFSKLLIVPRIYPQESEEASPDRHIFPLLNSIISLSQLSPKPFSSGGSMVFEKNFFMFLGGFNPDMALSEDHDIVHRAHAAGVIACVPKDVHIYISLRRFHREGRIQVYMKYIRVAVKTMQKGGLTKAPFEYQMGGGQEEIVKKPQLLETMIKAYLNKLKSSFPPKS